MLQLIFTVATFVLGYIYYPEQIESVVALTALVFLTFSYINFQLKRRFPWLYLVLSGGVFAYIYIQGTSFDVLTNAILSLALFFALLVHANWKATKIFLGKQFSFEELRKQSNKRVKRIKKLELTEAKLTKINKEFKKYSRKKLEKDGYLTKPMRKGKGVLQKKHRSKKGNELLERSKDLLYALLYGDEEINVKLPRGEYELLTLTIPRLKAFSLESILKAASITSSKGTWIDPFKKSKANDVSTDNIIIEVQYKEIPSEKVGDGIKYALLLINELEVNEVVLYFRMIKIEQSNLD